jgi:transcriptional regulator
MYRPPAFAEDRPEIAVELVERAAFGHLVVAGPDGLDAAPVPVLLDRDDTGTIRLRAHVAKANRIWRAAPCDALVIVPVTDAYVSPGWYPTKRDDPKVVPTWNYEVVHVHGRLVAHDDPAWLERLVRDLTDRHEARRPEPWSVDDAPADFVAGLLRAIVGVEMAVTRLEAKRKLSQNRSDDDQRGVVEGLTELGDARSLAVAESMRRPLA